ncbi:MAG: Rieske (2Fe-2S) protein [Deltaproteobacteria bacterium]|nr:Rieske (2Fe-2S) protein [Deltaproteobacteria bacterium]
MARKKKKKEKAKKQAPPEVSLQAPGPSPEESEDTAEPASSPEIQDPTTRRDFLTRTGHVVTGICALSAVAGGVRLALPDFTDDRPKRFPIGRLSDFKMNTLTWLREMDLLVTRCNAGIGAFSSLCTHLGCTVRRTQDGFECPCHGAKYGPKGEVLTGPARRDLPWYRVWLESDGRLWVDVAEPLPAGGPSPIALPEGMREEDA